MTFASFRENIQIAADRLGGTEGVRRGLGADAIRVLASSMREMRNGHLMMSWEWWSASDSQLQVAADAFMGNLRRPSVLDQPVKAQAEWNGAKLTLRGDCLYLEGGDLYWVVGMISARPEYDSRMRGMVDKWSAWITDEAVKATGREYGPGRHKSSSSGSREAAIKALRRIGEAFFNVNLVDVTNG